jgi:hypothetical protein
MAMDQTNIEIVLKRPVSATAPDLFGRPSPFPAGERIEIRSIDYPGKELPGGPAESWAFWTSTDIDLAAIFSADDVACVIVPPDHPLYDTLWEGPFGFVEKPGEEVHLEEEVSALRTELQQVMDALYDLNPKYLRAPQETPEEYEARRRSLEAEQEALDERWAQVVARRDAAERELRELKKRDLSDRTS